MIKNKLSSLLISFLFLSSVASDVQPKTTKSKALFCKGNHDCSHGEYCLLGLCTSKCLGSALCPNGYFCEGAKPRLFISGTCQLGCESNEDCPKDHSCISCPKKFKSSCPKAGKE